MKGRWLTDPRYVNGYINYLYQEGGNNRRYSESIADAAYAHYLVNGDRNFIVAQLDSMKHIYDRWIRSLGFFPKPLLHTGHA